MKLDFTDIIIFFQCACMLASAIFSLKLIGNDKIPEYMKNFYLYSLVAGVCSTYGLLEEYFNIVSRHVAIVIFSILLVFHFIFLSLFIYRVLPKKNVQKYIKFLLYLFLLTILFYLITNDLAFVPSKAITIANLGLVLFCYIYYFRLFKGAPKINLLKEPSFGIINGIFFCMCATVPIISLRAYLLNNVSMKLFYSLNSIGTFAYGAMHLFFIKAYLCSVNYVKLQALST